MPRPYFPLNGDEIRAFWAHPDRLGRYKTAVLRKIQRLHARRQRRQFKTAMQRNRDS